MILTETGTVAHFYLCFLSIILLCVFLFYVYITEHQTSLSKRWKDEFQKRGIDSSRIKHDDSVWYYDGVSTCIGFSGDFKAECPYFVNYCAGGNIYGNFEKQISAVKSAIKNGGSHQLCPLIYPGTD